MNDIDIPQGIRFIAGVDEVGRGPLAGPVVAAAVILDPDRPICGLTDSKALSAKKREILSKEIKKSCLAWALGRAEVEEIDQINILQASLIAMKRAVTALSPSAEYALIDGNRCPELNCPSQAIVKGDQRIESISAASIIAKVARDNEMKQLDIQYPGYGFAKHMGYPTKFHLEKLNTLGVTVIHRRSYSPVAKVLKSQNDKY